MLLGGVDLSMSAAVQPVATLPTLPSSGPPPPHNPLHHTAGGLALPALGSAPVMMPRPPTTAMPPLGPSLPPSHQDAADLAEAAPNQDVLLALLARNKNLEGKDSFLSPPPPSSPPSRPSARVLSSRFEECESLHDPLLSPDPIEVVIIDRGRVGGDAMEIGIRRFSDALSFRSRDRWKEFAELADDRRFFAEMRGICPLHSDDDSKKR